AVNAAAGQFTFTLCLDKGGVARLTSDFLAANDSDGSFRCAVDGRFTQTGAAVAIDLPPTPGRVVSERLGCSRGPMVAQHFDCTPGRAQLACRISYGGGPAVVRDFHR